MAGASSKYSLTFTQIVAEFSVDKELLGKQDPYIVFSSGAAKSQSKAIKNVGASVARWSETYTLPDFLPSKGTKLHVDVYNHNAMLPDNLIGGGYLDLATLGQEQLSGTSQPVQVLLTDKKGKSTGVLKFLLNAGGYNTSSGASAGQTATGTGAGTRSGAATTGATTGAAGAAAAGTGATTTNRTATRETDEAARTSKTSATGATAGTAATGATTGVAGPVEIDRKYYTEHEDRAEDQVLVEKFREHRPYVQEYETLVQPTGRVREVGANVEALGTEVRHVGSDQRQERVDLESRLPRGVVAQRPGGEGWVEGTPGPVIDAQRFEVAGERTADKERLTQLREHHDIKKEIAVKTQMRERELAEAAGTEVVDRRRERLGEAQIGSGTGAGYTTGTGGTAGQKLASHVPGTEAHKEKEAAQSYGTAGTGTGYNTGSGGTASQKIASHVPGMEAHREKQAAQGYGTAGTGSGAGYDTGAGYGSGAGYPGSNTATAGTTTTSDSSRNAETTETGTHRHHHNPAHREDEYAPRQSGQRAV